MSYNIALQIATYFMIGSFAFFVQVLGFWILKRWIFDK